MYKYVCNVGNEMIDYRENVTVKMKQENGSEFCF